MEAKPYIFYSDYGWDNKEILKCGFLNDAIITGNIREFQSRWKRKNCKFITDLQHNWLTESKGSILSIWCPNTWHKVILQ